MKNIISFNVLKGQYHFNNNRDYFIFLNLENWAEIESEDQSYRLYYRDVMVFNPLTAMNMNGECMLVFRIDIDQFRELFHGK